MIKKIFRFSENAFLILEIPHYKKYTYESHPLLVRSHSIDRHMKSVAQAVSCRLKGGTMILVPFSSVLARSMSAFAFILSSCDQNPSIKPSPPIDQISFSSLLRDRHRRHLSSRSCFAICSPAPLLRNIFLCCSQIFRQSFLAEIISINTAQYWIEHSF